MPNTNPAPLSRQKVPISTSGLPVNRPECVLPLDGREALLSYLRKDNGGYIGS